MTIDKSLRRGSRLVRSRNVLTRDERIERLEMEERWDDNSSSPIGLPKVRVIKTVVGKKKKKKTKDDEK